MSGLPGPLDRWSALGAGFPRDVAASMVPWLDALWRAVGPLRAVVRHGEGEPDGVDGVTRRAPFDRLLDTERLLATEVPDEFVRRAAQQELLYHALALKELEAPRASLMLVDAGPSQLGAPRLAHLALALVLASRAREAGARFAWGLLQEPPQEDRPPTLVMDGGATTPARLILDRRALPFSRDDLAAWVDFARRAGWDDLWLVGEDVTPSKRVRGGAVRVRDPVLVGAARLDVEIDHGGRVVHRALALPPHDVQARVLRDPRSLFAPAPPPPGRDPRPPAGTGRREDTAASAPILLAAGRKLACRNHQGDVLVFTVPTAGMKSGRPKRWSHSRGEAAIAAGWLRRRLVLLTRREDALLRFDWRGDVFPAMSRPLTVDDPGLLDALRERPEGAPLLALHFPQSPAPAGDTLLRLDDGRVVGITREGALRLVHDHALALGDCRGRLVMACHVRPQGPPTLPGVEVASFAENRRAAVLGWGWRQRYLVATGGAGGRWRFEVPDGGEVALEPGDEALGLIGAGSSQDPFGVVVLDEPRRAVCVRGGRPRELLRFSEALLGATMDPGGSELAVVGRSGALRAYRLPQLAVLVMRGSFEVPA